MPKAKKGRPIVSTHVTAQQGPKKRPRDTTSTAGTPSQQHKEHSNAPPKAKKQKHTPNQPHAARSPGPHPGQGHENGHHTGRRAGQGHSQLVCCSMVDRQAAKAMSALLHADAGQGRGTTIKSLTLAPHITAKKATYAVTCEAMKHLQTLKEVVRRSQLMQQPKLDLMSECTAFVLVYELIIGKGLHQRGPAEHLVAKHKARLQQALQQLLKEAGAKSASELVESRQAGPAPPLHPRWVRVNTLKTTVQQALDELREQHPAAEQDPLLPDLLRLPPGTSLHAHPLVASGAVVLQSKASAMPAHALAPEPGWHCVDCCAAPGNKTTHLAAIMQGEGRVDAYDKDPQRLARLQANATLTGSHQVITAHLQDFLTVDTTSPQFAQVRGVLLDPSCSGSGTLVSRQDHLLPSWGRKQAALQRVRQQQQQMIDAGGPPSPDGVQGPGEQQEGSAHAAAAAAAAAQRLPAAGDSAHGSRGRPDSVGGGGGGADDDDEEEEEHDGGGGSDDDDDGVEGGADDADDDDDMERVRQLAKFQETAVRHALTFPALQRLVYSTCSIHAEENELVVQAVLPQATELGFELEAVFPDWPRRGLPYFDGCEKLVRTDPYEDDTDGFFVAVFQRHAGGQQHAPLGDQPDKPAASRAKLEPQ